ncbi:hypothetical protein DM02DRAFT_660887 [Periconia macrospinosa]|uniref:Uncharacterized protein n=1 Tax=Periconia macrospinosa TaxID=97972 RepID=A0A2V1D937_9PLEO|nr:hypothetical protein DM02DRAFT_660887 [Periconia macrospinosa]
MVIELGLATFSRSDAQKALEVPSPRAEKVLHRIEPYHFRVIGTAQFAMGVILNGRIRLRLKDIEICVVFVEPRYSLF